VNRPTGTNTCSNQGVAEHFGIELFAKALLVVQLPTRCRKLLAS